MSATVERPPVLDGGYEDVRVHHGRRSGLTMTVAVHRTVAGRSLGGCRMQVYPTSDDVIRDARRLASAMTDKAAVSGLKLGGAKGVIGLPADAVALDDDARRRALRDFAELVESFDGRYVTAQDAGTSADDIAYMAAFTQHVAGRSIADGGCGDPSPYTAHGVEVAVQATAGSLRGRHVVVVGLGHVGGELAQRLHRAGARLTVSDLDRSKRALASRLSARWVSPEEAYATEADVLAPCALGGALDASVVRALRVPVVCGAANNQLADDSVADLLRERAIVWAPDFVVNAGGLIAVADEAHGFDRARAERAIEGIGGTLREIYARASATGTNTLIAARELAAERAPAPDEGGTDGDHI
jgi:leucine dehydrogenase